MCTTRRLGAMLMLIGESSLANRHIMKSNFVWDLPAIHASGGALRALGILATDTVVTASTYQRASRWPGVLPVSNDSPVLSPEEEMKTFYTAPGYHLELVASEP